MTLNINICIHYLRSTDYDLYIYDVNIYYNNVYFLYLFHILKLKSDFKKPFAFVFR